MIQDIANAYRTVIEDLISCADAEIFNLMIVLGECFAIKNIGSRQAEMEIELEEDSKKVFAFEQSCS